MRIFNVDGEGNVTATPSTAGPSILTAEALTPAAFAPYGDVIASCGAAMPINQGKGRRYTDLANVDVTANEGRAAISRVRCIPEVPPVSLRLMERHPLGSQAFIPLDGQRYLVVVARAGTAPGVADLHAFLCHRHQGINYHRGIWHHPMIALDAECEFVEVHRAGPGANCDEAPLPRPVWVRVAD